MPEYRTSLYSSVTEPFQLHWFYALLWSKCVPNITSVFISSVVPGQSRKTHRAQNTSPPDRMCKMCKKPSPHLQNSLLWSQARAEKHTEPRTHRHLIECARCARNHHPISKTHIDSPCHGQGCWLFELFLYISSICSTHLGMGQDSVPLVNMNVQLNNEDIAGICGSSSGFIWIYMVSIGSDVFWSLATFRCCRCHWRLGFCVLRCSSRAWRWNPMDFPARHGIEHERTIGKGWKRMEKVILLNWHHWHHLSA